MEKEYLYRKVYDALMQRIVRRELKPGDRIPSEAELSKQYGVSRITSKKVLTLLKQEGYVVRKRGLGTYLQAPGDDVPCERYVGLVADMADASYGLTLFEALEHEAARAGYRLIMQLAYGNVEKESAALRMLQRIGVSGLFMLPIRGQFYNTDILQLILRGFPVFLLDGAMRGIDAPFVSSDNRLGGRMLTEHLLEWGHTKIAVCSLCTAHAVSLEDRMHGYRDALEAHGVSFDGTLVLDQLTAARYAQNVKQQVEEDIEKIIAFLQAHPAVTAVIATQYSLAPLVREAARRLHRSVPETLSVACFDEIYDLTGGYVYTHVKQPEQQIAAQAFAQMKIWMEEGQLLNELRTPIPPIFRQGATTAKRCEAVEAHAL